MVRKERVHRLVHTQTGNYFSLVNPVTVTSVLTDGEFQGFLMILSSILNLLQHRISAQCSTYMFEK